MTSISDYTIAEALATLYGAQQERLPCNDRVAATIDTLASALLCIDDIEPILAQGPLSDEETDALGVRYREQEPGLKAEGMCKGLPYNTELANSNGVAVHLWTGALTGEALRSAIEAASRAIRNHRDVVYVTYSTGTPGGFWAKEHIL